MGLCVLLLALTSCLIFAGCPPDLIAQHWLNVSLQPATWVKGGMQNVVALINNSFVARVGVSTTGNSPDTKKGELFDFVLQNDPGTSNLATHQKD